MFMIRVEVNVWLAYKRERVRFNPEEGYDCSPKHALLSNLHGLAGGIQCVASCKVSGCSGLREGVILNFLCVA